MRAGRSLEDHSSELKLGFQRPPVPVHRLDTDTSGCLLLARNPKALQRVSPRLRGPAGREDLSWAGRGRGRGRRRHDRTGALTKISSAADGWRMIPAKKGKPSTTHWRRIAVKDGHHAGPVPARHRPHPPDPRPCGRRARLRAGGRPGLRYARSAHEAHDAPCRAADRCSAKASRRSPPRRRFPADFARFGFADPDE